MKSLLLSFFLLLSFPLFAQKKPVIPTMPDLAKLQKMSPAELEAYKQKMLKQYSGQAKKIADANDLKIDETLLPDFSLQPPPKDLARLALIPSRPPTLTQLADGLRESKKTLESLLPKPVLDEVKAITGTQTPAQQQSTSIAAFYAGKPAQALLLSMNSALQDIRQPTAWNNLAGLFNMTGLEHKAIPVLMTQIQQEPDNPTLLNNMGQAYLGLGDLVSAERFLTQCLAQDPLNPEAAHSMGIIKFFEKQFDEGAKYFEKELEVVYRRGTVALLKKHGRPANLYKLRKRGGRIPGKNYFEEIELAKFVLPEMPMTVEEEALAEKKAEAPLKSIAAEIVFWSGAALEDDPAARKAEGSRPPGVFSDLVDELLHGLNDAFPPENLSLLTTDEIERLKIMTDAYYAKLAAIKCPEPPETANILQRKAFAKKCCEEQTPVTDAFMAQYNGLVQAKLRTVQGRWKDYLNGLINIVSLDPNYGNRKLVYANVQAYFTLLVQAWQSARFEPRPVMGCDPTMTPELTDSLIASARNVDLHCPKWLNFEIDLQGGKLKGDCSKFEIELGKGIITSFEKNFRTGTSTLAAGVGASARFGGVGKASVKQFLYVSYDNNNTITDVGLKGKSEIGINTESETLMGDDIAKISSWVAGAEAGYTLGFESGFKSYVKGKGIIADYLQLENNPPPAPPNKLKSY